MPIYEYCCEKCGRDFDVFVRSATQRNEPQCPNCGSTKVDKAVSLFGVAGAGQPQDVGAACSSGPV